MTASPLGAAGDGDADLELTILMPCLDEAETVSSCVAEAIGYLRESGCVGEVLVADNGSRDGSRELAVAAGARVVEVERRGYGAALQAGIASARGRFVIMGDADQSYDFAALDPFLAELRRGADLVMGNRFAGGIQPGAMPALHRYLGNPVLSAVGRVLFRSPVRDFHCGLRGFLRASILSLDLQTTGMEFASEMVVRATLAGQRLREVPTVLRPDGRSRPPHLRSWRDGWRHLRFLLLFSPRWLFLYPGLSCASVGAAGSVLLASGLWQPGQGRLAEGLLIAFCGLLVIGAETTQIAAAARDFGEDQGLLPGARSRMHRAWTGLSLEITLIASMSLVVVGASLLAVSLGLSTHSDPNAARASLAFRLGTVGVTLGLIGVQLAFGAWLRSLLRLPRRRDGSATSLVASRSAPPARPQRMTVRDAATTTANLPPLGPHPAHTQGLSAAVRHCAGPWLWTLVLAGALVRAVAVWTYYPGVDFLGDSYAYLANASHLGPDQWHPLVYPLFLRVLSVLVPIGAVAAVQGLLGLLAGFLVYRLGRSFGLSDRMAALAAAPVLLDAWQIAVEQTIMSEPLFEVLLVGGLLLLVRRPAPSWTALILGGALLSLAVLTRTVALPVLALCVGLLVVRRIGWARVAVVVVAASAPVVLYAGLFAHTYGPFALSGLNGRATYGVAATFVRCTSLPPTVTNKMLCPQTPRSGRAGNNQYTWDVTSPLRRLTLTATTPDDRVRELNGTAAAFAREVIVHQPFGYARVVADTTLRYFTVGRSARATDYPQVAWQFLAQRQPPGVYDVRVGAVDFGNTPRPLQASPLPATAAVLRAYQSAVYMPGPALALAVILAAIGLLRGRRRRSEIGFLTLSGVAVLTMPSLGAGLDYRYLLPALLLLPLAGVLGLNACLSDRGWTGPFPRGRRATVCGAALLAGALAVTNVTHSGMVPLSDQTPRGTHAPGVAVVLSHGLTVRADSPVLALARCRKHADRLTWWWVVKVRVDLSARAGQHVVQAASLAVRDAHGRDWGPTTFRRARLSATDLPVVLSWHLRGASAVATLLLPVPGDVLRWADSTGGVAQWAFAPATGNLPGAGSACSFAGQTIVNREQM